MAMVLVPLAVLMSVLTFLLGERAFSIMQSLLNRTIWSDDPLPPLSDARLMLAVFWESGGPLFSAVTASFLFDSPFATAWFPGHLTTGSLAIGIATPIPAYLLLLSRLFDLSYGRALALQVGVMVLIALAFLLVCMALAGVAALMSTVMSFLGNGPA